jgi:hypothetical protein
VLRPALARALLAGVLVPLSSGASPVPDPTVAEARDTEAIVLHGSDLPTWAVPGNVTAKLPVTDLSCIAAVQDGCAHNHYAKPELDSSTVAAPSGPDVTRMTGWRWNGKAFQGVPFQVDEVFTRYLDNSASGYAVYSGEDQHTTYAFDREGFRYPKGTCVATPDPPTATDRSRGWTPTTNRRSWLLTPAPRRRPAPRCPRGSPRTSA